MLEGWRGEIASAHRARGRRSPDVPERRRTRLPLARSQRRDAVGRRGAAHPPREPDRLGSRRRDVHPRRAVDRAAPARQPAAARHARCACATSATPCSSSSTTRTRSARPITSSTSGPGAGVARRRRSSRRARPTTIANAPPNSLTGQYLSGRRSIAVPQRRATPVQPGRDRSRSSRRRGNNLQDVTARFPLGPR